MGQLLVLLNTLAFPNVGGVVALTVTLVSAEQFENATLPIVVSVEGRSIDVSAEQLANALFPIFVTPDGMLMLVRARQPLNA